MFSFRWLLVSYHKSFHNMRQRVQDSRKLMQDSIYMCVCYIYIDIITEERAVTWLNISHNKAA
jgi:hypothetical protein